ncbi:MAG: recombinase family protein [Alphaproteobacteria bacterium]|nr:recombinase family protein [Alphaproteobacteria bacterium]
MIYAYIRKSTSNQAFTHMEYEIKQYAVQHNIKIGQWVEESISSRKPLCKRELGTLLDELTDGDVLITTEISRLGRSILEVMSILQTCLNKNCQVITIKERYHLGNDIQSKVLAFAFGLSAEIERNLISQRTKAALTSKKAQGIKLGRPLESKAKALKLSKNVRRIQSLLNEGMPKAAISRKLNVNRQTLDRFLKRMEDDDSGMMLVV